MFFLYTCVTSWLTVFTTVLKHSSTERPSLTLCDIPTNGKCSANVSAWGSFPALLHSVSRYSCGAYSLICFDCRKLWRRVSSRPEKWQWLWEVWLGKDRPSLTTTPLVVKNLDRENKMIFLYNIQSRKHSTLSGAEWACLAVTGQRGSLRSCCPIPVQVSLEVEYRTRSCASVAQSVRSRSSGYF